jgi:hypothetical protein
LDYDIVQWKEFDAMKHGDLESDFLLEYDVDIDGDDMN